ncbi:MAG: FecR domain-containing protein [Proteiniphilum sp.]|jgi:hypothetical protein|nr:FecR domain-containing protein [Proteiniphilum sp.]
MKQIINHKDFLCDDLFIYWRTHPSEKLDLYWEAYLRANEEQRDEFYRAVAEFDNLKVVNDAYLLNEVALKKLIDHRIQVSKRNKLRTFYTSLSAAVLLLAVITTLFFIGRKTENPELSFASIGQVMNDSTVQLLAGGNVTDINNNATLDLSEKKNSAVIQDSLSQKEVTLDRNQTNRLIVPFGKRSSIVLADGSKVYLNSGTEMDFPSTFSNHSREIWVEGEIFIDVAHQRGTPFVIHTPNSEIIVYGTSFNVTSYSDESRESVVLVNGSVEVKSMNSSIRLKPNEMAVIENGALMRKEVDVSAYISWKKGYLQLSKTPLNEVLQQIGRYYNVEFRYPHNLSLGERTCSGKLYLSDNLEDVLKAFSKLTFLTYEINKETINIKQ